LILPGLSASNIHFAQDKVSAVFGCWTSVSRKSVMPVFEELNNLLFYPLQYEGEELSKNVFFSGARPAGEILIAASLLAGGAALARSRTTSGAWGIAVVAAFAAAHGHAHGVEAAGAFGSTLTGLVAASAAVTTAAVGIGRALLAQGMVLRWIGLAIAGAGFAIPALIN
jgi:hypothetical protein